MNDFDRGWLDAVQGYDPYAGDFSEEYWDGFNVGDEFRSVATRGTRSPLSRNPRDTGE